MASLGAAAPSATKNGGLHQQQKRFLSDDGGSHGDFAPKKKATVEGEDAAIDMIKDHVKDNKIMLYMKGSPSMPMCGFSAQVRL